ncbi:UNVERIFIED_CONTAM: hypothetical protein HDU68_002062 [Siphonaria sp. JEL0065]|nr:hypothetical protein HDU68_002062 [Siphonaria sp. JEL0065]
MLIVGGLDKQDDIDHLIELIDMALVYRDMFQNEITCPLVAGIVGKKTFCYEVYGDVVNTASRMLAIAQDGQIIVTSQVWEQVESEYIGTCIGEREVKGKGLMKNPRLPAPVTPESKAAEPHF